MGRTGAHVTRAGVARLARVSRSFTYENDKADTVIVVAQSKTVARGAARVEQVTAQQEAAWQERFLNAEDRVRHLKLELANQRRLVGDLLGPYTRPRRHMARR